MNLRPTQTSTFDLVRSGIQFNLAKLTRAQEQVATGKRILRPSDDAVGTSQVLSLRQQLGNVDSYLSSIDRSRQTLSLSASELQSASGLLTEARALIIQGMNGALNEDDRQIIAGQFDLLRTSLLDVANTRDGDRFLFAGTATQTTPFQEVMVNGKPTIVYAGNNGAQAVPVGSNLDVTTNVTGSEAFAKQQLSAVTLAGLSGATVGTSASSGAGYTDLVVRHESTTGALGAGLALVAGGANDTIMSDHVLTIDATAATIQLGSGVARPLPAPTDPDYSDFTIADADGSEVHIDFSAWTGADFTGTLTGNGSVSIDGTNFTAINFTETNLQLVDEAAGRVIHLDTMAISRAGEDLVTFAGAANLFDTLAGVAEDLRNSQGLDQVEILDRLNARLLEFDRGQENLTLALGRQGSRLERLESSEGRLQTLSVQLESLIGLHEDADLTSVIFDLTSAEQTLQVAQASGARLIQQSLLNFIR